MNLGKMEGLVSERLNEGQTGPTYYTKAEIVAALNEAQRFWALLTLGLEVTAPWTIPGASPLQQNTWFNMLPTFPDWIVPLRITNAAGSKIRPARGEELAALDSQWPISVGAPKRYAFCGVDLIGVYQQPAAPTVVNVTYARAPVPMVADNDVPEVYDEYQGRLVDYAIYRCRHTEGAGEFQKGLPFLGTFLDGAQQFADYVRSRNIGSRYDSVPFELTKFDRSQLLKLRKDLVPEKKVTNG